MDKQLLIFDFDGTLIDSVPDLADATNLMLEQLGRSPFPLDIIKGWIGNGARVLVERALLGRVIIDDGLDNDTVEEALRIFFAAYGALDCQKTTAYPDVSDGLHQLKNAGYTLALVTNKPIRFVPKILDHMGWTPLFSEVIGGDSLPTKKPDPAPLLYVCEALNVTPAQAIMIGDSRNDILAGQNANMDTLGLSYGYNYGQDIRELNPTAAFDDFAALVEYVLKKADDK